MMDEFGHDSNQVRQFRQRREEEMVRSRYEGNFTVASVPEPSESPHDFPSPTGHFAYRMATDGPRFMMMDGAQDSSDHGAKLSKKATEALMQAKEKVDREAQMRRVAKPKPTSDREEEYFALVENEKKSFYSTCEIVESEVPLCLENLDWSIVNEIIKEGHPYIYQSKGNHIYKCASCARDIPAYFAYFCLGGLYCAEHIPDVEVCDSCLYPNKETQVVKTYDGREVHLCQKCRGRQRCRDCSNPITVAEVLARRCERCRTKLTSARPYRPFSDGLMYAEEASEIGAVVKSNRIFSAELEMRFPNSDYLISASKFIPKEAGLNTDGSIQGDNGAEVQTPKLRGAKGEKFIEDTCQIVTAAKAEINDSCGLHVHLDGAGILPVSRKDYPSALLQLWKAHLVFEDVILSLVPFRRRFNRFSRPMRAYFTPVELDSIETIYGAERLWYRASEIGNLREAKQHHYHSSRYFGINFHPLFSQGHFEVRYHPATLNPKKVLEWANLHALIADAAVASRFGSEFLLEVQNTPTLSDKTNMLFDAIGLAEKSRAYFFERQSKFRDKKEIEEPGQKQALTQSDRLISVTDASSPDGFRITSISST